MFINNNHDSFHFWWKENFGKTSKSLKILWLCWIKAILSISDFLEAFLVIWLKNFVLLNLMLFKKCIRWIKYISPRVYFSLKLSPTSRRCLGWLIFFKNLFYQNNCKEAMNIEGDQIRGALFNFFVLKKYSFCIFQPLPSVYEIALVSLSLQLFPAWFQIEKSWTAQW